MTDSLMAERFDLEKMTREILLPVLGENLEREGLKDTPRRYASMMLELTEGLRIEPPKITTFEKGDCDQMIVVSDIGFTSLCEHHILPFTGVVHIGYLPGDRIAGLSKFARVADYFSRRPQTQEYMTAQIADFLVNKLEPKGLIVLVEANHLCMSIRGVMKPNHSTITSAIRGEIHKEEFFDILKSKK